MSGLNNNINNNNINDNNNNNNDNDNSTVNQSSIFLSPTLPTSSNRSASLSMTNNIIKNSNISDFFVGSDINYETTNLITADINTENNSNFAPADSDYADHADANQDNQIVLNTWLQKPNFLHGAASVYVPLGCTTSNMCNPNELYAASYECITKDGNNVNLMGIQSYNINDDKWTFAASFPSGLLHKGHFTQKMTASTKVMFVSCLNLFKGQPNEHHDVIAFDIESKAFNIVSNASVNDAANIVVTDDNDSTSTNILHILDEPGKKHALYQIKSYDQIQFLTQINLNNDWPEQGTALIYIKNQNSIFAVGGHSGAVGCDIIRKFDLETKQWNNWEKLPYAVSNADVAVSFNEEYMFVCGGASTQYRTDRRIIVINMKNKRINISHVQLPNASFVAVNILREHKCCIEFVTSAFVHDAYKDVSFNNLQYFPQYLIQMLSKWAKSEWLHVIDRGAYNEQPIIPSLIRNHWAIQLHALLSFE